MTTALRAKPVPTPLFKRRVDRWATKIGVQPKRVYVQAMRNKWASCSTAGRVYFSADLLSEPASFQDRVIAHELLHLLIPNHGALFKSFMNAYLPQGRAQRRDLACSRPGK
ncbi:MAG TPA: metal-dependent hydrolase [Elusimicrobia bacterium]|nr:MAG: hypothetical protein A2X37_10065 [Elusimicrobia bacterium GWA2_66_18]HAZ07366.1 metal-dependent hydrolase [Elusimicrobiota bacterium]